MKIKENAVVFGNMHIVLRDKDDNIKDERIVQNTTTTYAKEEVAAYMTTAGNTDKPAYMAVGTGTPSASGCGTQLSTRVTHTSSTSSGAVLTMVASFAGTTYAGAITEAATHTASTGTTCWTYASFTVINVGSSDTLTITWTITVN